MSNMKIVTVEAFEYEHEIMDSWNDEEIEFLENAPIIYIISGDDQKIENFSEEFLSKKSDNQDLVFVWTEAGEALVIGYEDLTEEQEFMLDVLGLTWDYEDQSEDEEVA